MCIFSGPVHEVSKTKIYCRIREGKQTLVYSMDVGFDNDVAMILPIPVSERKEDAVTFVNLKDHTDFFKDLDKPFVVTTRGSKMLGAYGCAAPLKVHEVGDYIASFVPHRLFFERLDEVFRLDESIWNNLPQYGNFGFAVFQLKNKDSDSNHYHPMGFAFPTKTPEKLFFPTVHVHDGKIHTQENFDHALYFQFDRTPDCRAERSYHPAKDYITSELVDPDKHIYKRRLQGSMENKDIYVE